MTTFRTAWHDAFGQEAARVPRAEPSIQDMIGTPGARQAQADAAYRRAVRQAKAAGRPTPQRLSIERRFRRYAARTGNPSAKELKAMRRVYHAERRKTASRQAVLDTIRRVNQVGGAVVIDRPYLRVSPKTRRGDRRGRPRGQIIAQFRPGELAKVEDAFRRGDDYGADDALTALIIAEYTSDLTGTDTTITEVDGSMTLHISGGR